MNSRHSQRICRAASATASLVASATLLGVPACSPSYEGLQERGGSTSMQLDDREAEANRAALDELVERARAQRALNPDAPAEEPDLEVVVLRPSHAPGTPIPRATVTEFIERGPHALFGVVDLVPARNPEGEVLGFELQNLREGSEWIRAAGFTEGDVVRRVNDRSVILPDAFVEVWADVPTQPALTIDVLRGDGREESLAWPISP